ncbi:hypothetical protein C809_04195 [Lachnospiraceae bacterium MD335]|nr:hypothetical protein C809_04195 [Lachnospiraceae bacterium MD335]
MKTRWKDIMLGFIIGILVVLAVDALICTTNENLGEDLSKLQDIQQKSGQQQSKYLSEQEMQQTENKSEVSKEADGDECKEYGIKAKSPQGFRVSKNMEIPQVFIEELLLYQYIEYGVRKYNEDTAQNNRYIVDIHEDMLPYDTAFSMKTADGKPYKIDLAKELLPELSGNKYNFMLHGQDEIKYISIDTYNMKIYIYDMIEE